MSMLSAKLFEPGANIRAEMISYIRENFSDLLGEHASLLDEPDGLERLAEVLADEA